MALDRKLDAIALTDHDTLAGLDEFLRMASKDALIAVPGVEISTQYQNEEAHLLGYFIPLTAKRLERRLRWLEEVRRERFPKMVSRLEEMGIDVPEERVRRRLKGVKTPGRPHLARILVDLKVVKDTVEAFDKYLGKGKPAYVKKDLIGMQEGIELLIEIGAVPVLAHPFTIKTTNMRSLIVNLKEMGLCGVEVYYDYEHLRIDADESKMKSIASDLGLIQTGGSDHHGDKKRSTMGSITVSLQVVEELRAIANNETSEIKRW